LLQLTKLICAAGFTAGVVVFGLLADDLAIKGVSFAFLLFLGGPILILVWKDTGQALRKAGVNSARADFWGRVFGYPQAIFGLLCTVVAVVLLPMLLYEWLVHGQVPQGPWLAAPVGFLVFGLYLMRDAFRAPEEPEPSGPQDDDHGI
jgi:membrane protease YdiL (CAAX protease family)